jgi:hypothetical protein
MVELKRNQTDHPLTFLRMKSRVSSFLPSLVAPLAAALAMILTASVLAADSVLMVVGDPAALSAGDSGVKERLEYYGFQVVVVDDAASAATNADGKVLVLTSSTVNSGNVGDKFRDVTVPVLNWEQALEDNYWMAYDVFHGDIAGQTEVVITAEGAAHLMGAGLSAGVHQVVTNGQTFSWAYPNENMQAPYSKVIATLNDGDSTHVCIYGYETGDALINPDGTFPSAPARRVHVFLQDNTFAALTAEGLRLFDAALGWAVNRTLEASTATISITSPAEGAKLPGGTDLAIAVSATDPAGPIQRVVFYANDNQIGESAVSPFSFTWTKPLAGNYRLIAKAVDQRGRIVASRSVNIIVGTPAPAVLLIVGDPAAMTAGDSGIKERLESYGFQVVVVDDSASATNDADGKVLVLNSSTVTSGNVGDKFRDVTVPVVNWEQALEDNYWMTYDGGVYHAEANGQTEVVITAEGAAHALGAGLSAGVHQVVTSGQTFTWGYPNFDLQTPYCKVIATLNDGDPTHVCIYGYDTGDALINPDGTFPPAPARRAHVFLQDNTFTALTPEGLRLVDAALGWAMNRTLVPSTATISISSPAEGAKFTVGANISLTVNAADPSGPIQQVRFYANGTQIGESRVPPFSITWSNVAIGNYVLSAKAMDEAGRIVTSQGVSIIVGAPAPGMLLVVGTVSVPNLNVSDTAIQARLQAAGYDVRVVADSASTTADANAKVLVIISSTITSGNVSTKFRNVTVPVIDWEHAVEDDFGMTGNASTDHNTIGGQTDLEIINSSHPLAAGLSGTVTITSIPETFTWGLPVDTAIKIAQIPGDPTKYPFFAYETGALMFGGFAAPARRVLLPMGDTTFENLTADGLKLFDAAVAWALAGVPVAPPKFNAPSLGPTGMTLSWTGSGTLEQADSPPGTWSAAPSQSNPQTVPATAPARFYRIRR